MTSIAMHARRAPDVPLSRREWKQLPSTSPAKSVTARHANAALIATAIAVLVVVVAASYRAAASPAAVAGGLFFGAIFAVQAVVLLDRLMRWRCYLSLFTDQPASR
jgi:uncharacterized membrane protein YkvI